MAEDYTSKRMDMGSNAVEAATQVVEGMRTLLALQAELSQAGGGFEDSDCVGTLAHCNAWKLNNLCNVVAPALKLAADTPIGGGSAVTHLDLLYAVKRA